MRQGDPRLNPAHNYYEYDVTDVKANVPVTTMPVPDVVRTATIPPVKVESQKLADGIWLLGGGTHNSVLMEFKNFAAVVEAPQNEARSLAVIEEANRLAPNKLIRIVDTHLRIDCGGAEPPRSGDRHAVDSVIARPLSRYSTSSFPVRSIHAMRRPPNATAGRGRRARLARSSFMCAR